MVVRIDHVSKEYTLYQGRYGMLKSFLFPSGSGNTAFRAVNDISLELQKGEILGIIGLNGSGKSTLVRMMAGIISPTEGQVEVKGKAELLAPGAGLNARLTGRENIYYKCLLAGYRKDEILKMQRAVTEFAEIGSFLDQPLRTYSSGMRARLGFAISVQTDPDILLIDEALSVGDTGFMKKCKDKIKEFGAAGKTIVFVTHSVDQMKNFCTRTIWMHSGEIIKEGDAGELIHSYKAFVDDHYNATPRERKEMTPGYLREKYGSTDG